MKRNFSLLRATCSLSTCFALAAYLSGCATGTRPVSSFDIEAIRYVQATHSVWHIDVAIDSRHTPQLIAVLFDGTRNDRNNVSNRARATAVSDLKETLDRGGKLAKPAHYVSGVGTSGIWPFSSIDAAAGLTTVKRAEMAFEKIREDIREIQSREPDADIRVLVVGFSRGAASARHFLNLIADVYDVESTSVAGVRQYAILFDTVATGLGRRPRLGIPANVDHALHFVAGDERRIFFRPTLDVSSDNSRIETLVLPGVHSDQVGVYQQGIGLTHADRILQLVCRAGLMSDEIPCFTERRFDPTLQGMHDSRWLLERALRVDPSQTLRDLGRSYNLAIAAALSPARQANWHVRANTLNGGGRAGSSVTTESTRPVFEVTRSGDAWMVKPIKLGYQDSRLLGPAGSFCLQYTLVNGSVFHLPVPDHIYGRIAVSTGEGRSARLEVGIVVNDELKTWWLLDGLNLGSANVPKLGSCPTL